MGLAAYAKAGFEIHGRQHDELVRRAWHRGYYTGLLVTTVLTAAVDVIR